MLYFNLIPRWVFVLPPDIVQLVPRNEEVIFGVFCWMVIIVIIVARDYSEDHGIGWTAPIVLGFSVATTFLVIQSIPYLWNTLILLTLVFHSPLVLLVFAIPVIIISAITISYFYALRLFRPMLRKQRRRFPQTSPTPPTPLVPQSILEQGIQEAHGTGDPPSCTICKRTIAKGEAIVICPFCQSRAHQIHMENWLLTKRTCPLCRERITKD